MQLLVSVSDVDEAQAALVGGAIIIDAKNPFAGALGPVPLDEFRRIATMVGGIRPVSAALGDADDESAMARAAGDYARAGAAFVKTGITPAVDRGRLEGLIGAAVRGVGTLECGVIAVAYADSHSLDDLRAFSTSAAHAGAAGVLIDTADKDGPGLRALCSTPALTTWIAHSRQAGLIVAVAGKLTLADITWARKCGADIAGVRGAACDHGRTGRVVSENVRQLRAAASALAAPEPAPETIARSLSS
jgi:uncharacterized protein (UPF0264 family)